MTRDVRPSRQYDLHGTFFWRPLTPPAMGWKLKGASRTPVVAVRRRWFRIVLIIVRRPPRGDETVSRGWRPRPWPWSGSAGWWFIERGLSLSPTSYSPFRRSSGAVAAATAATTPAAPLHPIHATFSPTRVITSGTSTPPLSDYLKVSRLDGFLATISF